MSNTDAYKKRLALALEAAGMDLWENDLTTGSVVRKAEKIFAELGYDADESHEYMRDIFKIVHPDDTPRVVTAIADHMNGATKHYRCEFRVRAKAGEWVWLANYGRVMDVELDHVGKRFIGVTFNIDERKRNEDALAEVNRKLAEQNALLEEMNAQLLLLANSDGLTGLHNRRKLMELGAVAWRRNNDHHVSSLLIVDIDYFKRINDAWGHPAGDQVICAIAKRCRATFGEASDAVARIGGEEFAVLLSADHETALRRAEALRQAVAQEAITLRNGKQLSCTISIGVATAMPGCASFEQLLGCADKALYIAKQNGRNDVYGALAYGLEDTSFSLVMKRE